MSTSQPQAPALIPLVRPPSFRPKRQTQSETSALRSPFFRPSNPRLSTIKTPSGTKRPAVVINDVPVKDEEKKSSLLGAWANLCNVTIGAGIVGLVSFRLQHDVFAILVCIDQLLYSTDCCVALCN
jgi:hypothetical protein